jgi:prepilin-type N-terminal cleavage/methylation domain-containing protein/prepilin-type processing-associated H-X9-DG protein
LNATIGQTPSLIQRLWFSVVCMRFWQWGLLSLVLGCLGIWLYGQRDTVPRNPADRVTLDDFLSDLNGDRLPNGKSPVSNIEIYPWNDGVRLVTFKLATPDGNTIDYSNHFLYEISRAGTPPVKISEIATSAGVPPNVVHWIGPPIKLIVLWGGGAVVGIGVLWPLMLHRLRSKGYGPKIPDPVESPIEQPAPMAPASPESGAVTPSPVQPSSAQPSLVKLSSEPLESAAARIEKEKKYRGEFYPVEHPGEDGGFTLVELLVVIGIIGILIALILPTLAGARQAALQLQCASNLRNIGLGIVIYLDQNQGVYPPAYLYVNEQIDDGVETPPTASAGYVHWSIYLYGTGTVPQAAAFQCPALDRGGLPPDDATADNLDPGQVPGSPDAVDQQVPRLAYTLNEALCPRNKFVLGFQGAVRVYQYVRATQVANSSGTILGTEWGPTGARINETTGSGYETVSHRPVHGFVGLDGTLDMYLLNPSTGFRQVTAADLDPDPASGSATTTRLDWVGRNHGKLQGYPDKRRSNFLYADGHLETKSIYETLTPFQWGQQFYTLNPNDDMQSQ